MNGSVTTIILTFNEEVHIARSIASAKAYSSDILVVDSFSTDKTVDIAKAAGARVMQNKFVNQARQFNWALEHGEVTTDWILRLDADEIIGADLAERINRDLAALPADVSGITFDRRHIFMGRWVRRGGRYPLRLLRLWRNGKGAVEDRWMDEHVVISDGRIIHMAGQFDDASLMDLTFFTAKHNAYATREAIEVLNARYGLFGDGGHDTSPNMGRQARVKRFIKERIFNKMPFGTGPLAYFLYRYVIQLGFLDGKTGLIYHFLQGFWYRFLVNAKIVELERIVKDANSREERIAVLAAATGLRL
ncbi:glycosyltransferase family 2 protein [Novosphingobium sp. KACC 22771]|uniref:glycosyltransferase family 2 protein n=1 Tax=Novosphingobium sp. KACC 22771 TaxID=3025670 RepID=UPI002366A7B6|nr:glycosyltransferase family 2 protein [Novosphingobium sp. KACC 22771]WDF72872.1 glycosyltransferase family 2 protein [Novosphingobium sp. KACC 22771]